MMPSTLIVVAVFLSSSRLLSTDLDRASMISSTFMAEKDGHSAPFVIRCKSATNRVCLSDKGINCFRWSGSASVGLMVMAGAWLISGLGAALVPSVSLAFIVKL